MNNREWLNTLSDEDLAAALNGRLDAEIHGCPMCLFDNDKADCYGDCATGIYHWLRTEHEEPDTWEKIEADAHCVANDYWKCEGISCDICPARIEGRTPKERYGVDGCFVAQKLDIVRRCKALAEKERGE